MRNTLKTSFFPLWPIFLACGGCETHRFLTVRSDPAEALVYLNDQEFGRTPVTREFKWYGTYQVEIRKEGYETIRTKAKVWAPWWQWIPFDLFVVFLPGPHEDRHELYYTLHEPSLRAADPKRLIERGEILQSYLERGPEARTPRTKPATTRPR